MKFGIKLLSLVNKNSDQPTRHLLAYGSAASSNALSTL
jgi:hypothetical protein